MEANSAEAQKLLDKLDREIIGLLRQDGRLPFSELARQLGRTEATIRQRYNRLVSLGIIYVVGMYDETKIGGIAAHVGIRVDKVPVRQVAAQLVDHPHIKYVACTLGYYDILLDVTATDAMQLGGIVLQDLRKIRGVAEVETLTVLQVCKDSYAWEDLRAS